MLKIEFDVDNAAYHFDGEDDEVDGESVAITLREVARSLEVGFTSGRIVDPNGNHVGHWALNA